MAPTARGQASAYKFKDMNGQWVNEKHHEVSKYGESLFQQSLTRLYEKLGYTVEEIKDLTEKLEPAGPRSSR